MVRLNKRFQYSSLLAALAVLLQAQETSALWFWWWRRARGGSGTDLETCTPVAESNFNITVVNMGSDIDPALKDAFVLAAARWSRVIVGDVTPDFPAGIVDDWFSGEFDAPYTDAVDDLVIGFALGEIDGPGGTLGFAGPQFVRVDDDGNALAPISGVMKFDIADVSTMPIDDFKVVVLHEMGHVLGLIGTTTDKCQASCDPDNSLEQKPYACPLANAEYEVLMSGTPLELENSGGIGTACGHWEEDSFLMDSSSEIMTGFFEEFLFQPLSLVTVAALDDLEVYEVDYCGADIWPATATTAQASGVIQMTITIDMDSVMKPVLMSGAMYPNGTVVAPDTLPSRYILPDTNSPPPTAAPASSGAGKRGVDTVFLAALGSTVFLLGWSVIA